MRNSIEHRVAELERQLSTRPKFHVIDATSGDPDAMCDVYYATTPKDEQAEIVIVLRDPTRRDD